LRLQCLAVWDEDNSATIANTGKSLQQLNITNAMRGVMFARQAGESRVARHSDGRNFILMAHLGLIIPKQKELGIMAVVDDTRFWETGKLLMFDTFFLAQHTQL
jgi:hypothetical protein